MSHTPFSERAIQLIAEDKIRAAIVSGDFDSLPGFGKPLSVLHEPYDPLWWIRRKIQLEELSSALDTRSRLTPPVRE